MSLVILLLYALLILAVAGGVYTLGNWFLGKVGAPQPINVVWNVLVVIVAILALIQLFGGGAFLPA